MSLPRGLEQSVILVHQDMWETERNALVFICHAILFPFNDECLLITDVDECNGTSICQQVCINTPGSFECGCEQGYELSGTTDCIGTTPHLSPL
jgi:hypothetical protein